MGHAILDTVLGLAITPSTIGWVMADAGGLSCPTVIGEEVGVAAGDAGPDAVDLAAQAAAVAGRVRTMLASRGERLHGVAVTWSDEAAVGAALLLESLAAADFEHVVPVRYSQAAMSLTTGIGPQHAPVAVCVVEANVATLVLSDRTDSPESIVTACPISCLDDVTGWLGDTVASVGQRPEMLMVAGSVRGMDRLGRRLESALSIPVFVLGGVFQALAAGAAQALAPHAELAWATHEAPAAGVEVGNFGRRRVRSLSYAGALLMLTAGSVTFVASVAAALSLQLGPSRTGPDPAPPQRVTVARVAVPAAPAQAAAPALPPPAAPAPPSETSEEAPTELGSLWDAPPAGPDLQESAPAGAPSLLQRVRDRIHGLPGR
ncbi:hypothetical protein [Mycolicibacter icosiumassiliensis]|uniref:hypothetical protein n=1 Tax=Mycolicibacter icosiumassiliensis TaxID=1792835 RepID=UPI000829ABBB|nr:hypothetical protein [Mycolicibacter icosiumassiliensis]